MLSNDIWGVIKCFSLSIVAFRLLFLVEGTFSKFKFKVHDITFYFVLNLLGLPIEAVTVVKNTQKLKSITLDFFNHTKIHSLHGLPK